MKVLLTILEREDAIKVDFPILPQYDSKIYLSPDDYKKLEKTLNSMEFTQKELHAKITKKEKEMAATLMLENSTVQAIDIAWDEDEKAYLPLVCISLGDDFFGDNFNDMDFDNDIDEDNNHENIEDESRHKKQNRGKKKNLFN